MAALPWTLERNASVDVLAVGSLTSTAGKVVSTCTLIRDAGRSLVVDPGMADSDEDILGPLRALGYAPAAVTDVILGHHHPDHTLRAGLFSRAAVHDHWATYEGSRWTDADAEGRLLTPAVGLLRVPGHTLEDIATVVGTAEGLVVLTHLWFTDTVPIEDPTADDAAALHNSRERILAFADLIVPGHGPAFRPSPATPR